MDQILLLLDRIRRRMKSIRSRSAFSTKLKMDSLAGVTS